MMTTRNRRQRTPTRRRWTTVGMILLGVVLGVGVVFTFFFDEMGASTYMRMRKQAWELERGIRALERSNTALREEMERVQHDPVRIEELAREQLGLVRQGETVYQVVHE